MTKSIFQSKTLWFNALTILVAAATFFGYTPNQEMAEGVTTYLLSLAPVVNIALRLVTKKAVRF